MIVNSLSSKSLYNTCTLCTLSIDKPPQWILSILFFFLFLFLAPVGNIHGRADTVGDPAERMEPGEKLTVWAAPAERKVRPGDEMESRNLIWSAEKNQISLSGAGNEHVPFQVIISQQNERPEEEEAPDGFFIEASDLTSEQGATITSRQFSFYLQHHILLTGRSSPVGDTGHWPDALAPVEVPFGMDVSYSNSRPIWVNMLPVWIDFEIPTGTPAGIYTGDITVTRHGESFETLGLEVEVFDFSLPDETAMITYMDVSRNRLADYYNMPESSEEIEELTQTYYEFLYDNRMESWFNDMLLPDIDVSNEEVEVTFDDERYRYYMNDLKTKRVLLNAYPGALRRHNSEDMFSERINRKVKSYLSQVESYFDEHGWKDHLVINSPIDEPNSREEYERIRQWTGLVDEAAPEVPFLVTKTPITPTEWSHSRNFYDSAFQDWGTLRGYAENYSVHGNQMNDPKLKQVIAEEQAKGGEITWYVSCDQKYPQPNFFIDAPALDPVMIPWITDRYGMAGILYWELVYWDNITTPWVEAETSSRWFGCSGGWNLNGEGYLFYPGNATEQFTGQPDVDGPVSSIRFELLREGIEDFEYLQMLRDLGDEEFADEQVQSLVVDVSAFSRNLEKLYRTREAMARRLEGLTP